MPLQHNTQPVNFKEWLISLNARHHHSGILSTLCTYALMWITNVVIHTFIYSKPALHSHIFHCPDFTHFLYSPVQNFPVFTPFSGGPLKNVKFGFTVQSRISQLIRYKHSEVFWNDIHQFSYTDCVYSVLILYIFTVKWLTLWSKSKMFCPCNIIYILSRWSDMLT